MMTSEVILRLQALVAEHGDREFVEPDKEYGGYNVVDTVDVIHMRGGEVVFVACDGDPSGYI